jgi:hypothetical protein
MRRKLGGEREHGAHHGRRNCPGKPADLRISVDEFRRIGEDLREGEKRLGGGDRGLFIAGLGVEEGLGFGEIERRAVAPCGRRRARPEVGDDMWGRAVSD